MATEFIRVKLSKKRQWEFASERTGTRHAPRTMRLLLWSHDCLIESRNRDDGGLARYGASSGGLRIMRLRPFPEPARRTTHRDTHDWHPFSEFQKIIYGDDLNIVESIFAIGRGKFLRHSL